MTRQICTKCHFEKELTEFFAEKRAANGKRTSCKSCDAERRRVRLGWITLAQRAERNAERRRKHSKTEREQKAHRRKVFRANELIRLARLRAAKRGLPFDLDEHQNALQARVDAGRCELTGVPFNLDVARSFDTPSIDRIKPELGYVYSNVRVICFAANCALGNWGEDVFLGVVGIWLETIRTTNNKNGSVLQRDR